MNHQNQQYFYKSLDPDLHEYLSEYKNQTPLESDHYAGKSNFLRILTNSSVILLCYLKEI